MNKKIRLFNITFCLTVAMILLYSVYGLQPVTVKNDPVPKATLWRIEKPGHKSSYLFGTLHTICMDDFVLSTELRKAMQETSVLCCETARNKQNKEQNNQQKRNTHSGDLRKQIGAHYFARLQQILKVGFNIPDTALNRLTPGEAIALIDNFGFPCRLISYENRLKKIAQSQNMSVTGFETEEEHRAIAKILRQERIRSKD